MVVLVQVCIETGRYAHQHRCVLVSYFFTAKGAPFVVKRPSFDAILVEEVLA